jgi:hypothetical protein
VLKNTEGAQKTVSIIHAPRMLDAAGLERETQRYCRWLADLRTAS